MFLTGLRIESLVIYDGTFSAFMVYSIKPVTNSYLLNLSPGPVSVMCLYSICV